MLDSDTWKQKEKYLQKIGMGKKETHQTNLTKTIF